MNSKDRPTIGSWFRALFGRAQPQGPANKDQLIEILRAAHWQQILDVDSLAMLEGALQFSEMQARDIMIPRSQMVVVGVEESPEEFLPVVIKSAHSRFPVIGESRDEVVGILLAKDVLHWREEEGRFNLRENLRPVVFIPESKRLNVLLKEFRSSRNHIAIVVDEYGGVAGMVTIEDVLEQIVGDIEDEHDLEEGLIHRHTAVRHTVKAVTPIEEFNEYFSASLNEEGVDTVGGLLIRRLGHLPVRGESLEIERFRFKVLRADNRRIHLLQVNVSPLEPQKISMEPVAEGE
ncbi:MAG: CBS domain-containing protein [Gammaproteobacteria bacterium]|jgi:magnesium and cobalt transporter|nr:CBS domain-containing protein [Gammaproteobacteria bacterium]MBT4607014.1 CBS domain-containing protein [Thiotrichales bacterium]MBT3472660.1 CBS domain-containing protein [Gammaproteobacteria bacterium]MBT3967139.1 CBS domain-containing protein [Gammaproteobacteria bacterium]MBT4080557.1 CBS domain-containing protein [Gammaproteobacteria bacterium]